jgi:hypothetical protein
MRAMMVGALGVILAVVYVDYANFKDTWNDGKGTFTKVENAVYQAVGRLLFALAISVVTLLCVTTENFGRFYVFGAAPSPTPLGNRAGATLLAAVLLSPP